MILPTIHRNGTSKRELIDALCEAGHALALAIDKMAATAPNGRDYYLTPGALFLAISQHEKRHRALYSVLEELQAQAEAIDASAPD